MSYVIHQAESRPEYWVNPGDESQERSKKVKCGNCNEVHADYMMYRPPIQVGVITEDNRDEFQLCRKCYREWLVDRKKMEGWPELS